MDRSGGCGVRFVDPGTPGLLFVGTGRFEGSPPGPNGSPIVFTFIVRLLAMLAIDIPIAKPFAFMFTST